MGYFGKDSAGKKPGRRTLRPLADEVIFDLTFGSRNDQTAAAQ